MLKIIILLSIIFGEIMAVEKNIKNDDFILHLDGRRNGFGVYGTYDINIIYTNKILSVYLLSKMDTYYFDKNDIAIETDISKKETKIFYLNNDGNKYILYLLSELNKNKNSYRENFILSEDISNFSMQTSKYNICGIIYDNKFANYIKLISIFVMKKYGKDLDFLRYK